jgi:hypothetical protein
LARDGVAHAFDTPSHSPRARQLADTSLVALLLFDADDSNMSSHGVPAASTEKNKKKREQNTQTHTHKKKSKHRHVKWHISLCNCATTNRHLQDSRASDHRSDRRRRTVARNKQNARIEIFFFLKIIENHRPKKTKK